MLPNQKKKQPLEKYNDYKDANVNKYRLIGGNENKLRFIGGLFLPFKWSLNSAPELNNFEKS